MRTISADHEAVLTGAPKARSRFSVKDSGGTWRDLTTYAGVNILKTLTWREGIDDAGMTWEATFQREVDQLSVAPLLEASALNHGFNHASSYAPLIAPGREAKIEWALQAADDPGAPSWTLAMYGYVDKIQSGGPDTVVVQGRGLEKKLINCFIERERIYAFAQGVNADRGCYVFEPSESYIAGDRVLPTDSKRNDHFYVVSSITTGIAASTEPLWPTGGGATVVSGGVTFTEAGATSNSTGLALETILQQMLDDNLGSGVVTLACPVSPAWVVRWFLAARQPLFEELRLLADQIGWCIRYLYDAGSATFKLTLYDPLRSTTTSLRSFSKSEVESVPRADVEDQGVRNAVQVVFSDSQDLDASSIPKRKKILVTDSASIAKFGRLFCEMQEASTSNIDTLIEANALANRVLSDLKDPLADLQHELRFFPFIELCDLITFTGNGVHYDTDQKMAVVSYEHVLEADTFATRIEVRGQPASGWARWLARMTDASEGEGHALTEMQNAGPFSVLTASVVGGTRGLIQWQGAKKQLETDFEVHVSASNGFTPSSSTVVSLSRGREFEVADLEPGTTYYLVVVPLTWNASRIIRGQPSAQTSFVAGYAEPAHLNPETVKQALPPNGGFEGFFAGDTSSPPSHWEMESGDWDHEIEATTTADGARTGVNGILFTSGSTKVDPTIRTKHFPATAGADYSVGCWVNPFGTLEASDDCIVAVEWYDFDKALLSTSSFTTDLNSVTPDVWNHLVRTFTAPADTRFAKIYLRRDSVNFFTFRADDVHFDEQPAVHLVGGTGEPAFAGTWVNFNSASHAAVGFWKDPWGVVHLTGLAKSGTIGTAIFTLPVGYRPSKFFHFPQVSNGAFAFIHIDSSGNVVTNGGSNAWFSLDGISFRPG